MRGWGGATMMRQKSNKDTILSHVPSAHVRNARGQEDIYTGRIPVHCTPTAVYTL